MLDPAIVIAKPLRFAPGQILSPGHPGCGAQTQTAGANTLAPGHAASEIHLRPAGGNHLDSGHASVATQIRDARVNTLTPVHIMPANQKRFDRDTFAPPTGHPKPNKGAAAQDLTPGHATSTTQPYRAGGSSQTNKGAANE